MSLEEEFSCAICLEVAKDAVETGCCHHIFCHECIQNCPDCPLCRCKSVSFHPSVVIRRLINNLSTECEYCQRSLTRGGLQAHHEVCEQRPMKCPKSECTFHGKTEQFLQHLVEVHRREVLANVATIFDVQTASLASQEKSLRSSSTNSTSSIPEALFIDPIATTINATNHVARLGSTGKYYCGGRLQPSCTCCNGDCGPGNGCNCCACMRLDVERRRLPRGYLVNREGAVARRGQENRFYCGRRVLLGVFNCDGYCGPTDGPNCRACQVLDSVGPLRHADLL